MPTACSNGAQKLGQPVPLSNLVVEENSSSPQPAQVKVPLRCSLSKGLLKGASVPLRLSTAYWLGLRSVRHSASVCVTAKRSPAKAGASV